MKSIKLLLVLVLSLIVISNAADYHCSCVGCNSALLVKGSPNWCRCCENALVPTCQASLTDDERCKNSVFDAQGCLRDGYLTNYCLNSTSSDQTNHTTMLQTTMLTTTSLPYNNSYLPEASGRLRGPDHPCNCVLCSSSMLLKGSWNWCRCCRVLFDRNDGLCYWHRNCERSVFDQQGCVESDWEGKCAWTQEYLDAENEDSTSPSYSLSNQVDDPPPAPTDITVSSHGLSAGAIAGIVIGVLILLLFSGLLVGYFVVSRVAKARPTL